MKKTTLLIFMALCVAIFPQTGACAYTVYCTNCSDKVTQALDRVTNVEQLKSLYADYAESIQQTASQLQMVQQNIEQYANMVQNTVAIPSNLIKQISTEMTRFAQITNSLNTMRNDVMGLENVFDALYLTQDNFAELASMPRDALAGRNITVRANIKSMSTRVDEATLATFQLSGIQLKDLEMSGETESYMNELLSTPEGQMQALMSGNQLAAMQIQEARQLRELIATSTQSNLASQIKEEKTQQLQEELENEFLDFKGINDVPLIEELPLF